jgi:diaminohydroxyphosphoribosylaminopyrimidine deaminase / 5-amino-6-(5-phosphoribosylamino)uracil reductase
MDRALAQAKLGAGLASPNPTVGCVIVNDGDAVGEGFHAYDERDHAEIVALRNAGERARGATAYVTLEPCSHRGRTGPCANALIAAGVARVVVAVRDPNPEVNGHGISHLVAAGVRVTVGVKRIEAQRLNDAFARFILTGLPLVTMKAGLTLDGRIAPAAGVQVTGEPYWISGEESRAEVHRMRHASDAILLGINSVVVDDPLLTDRSELPRRRPLLRTILDSRLRLPLDSRLVCSAAEDLIVFCTGCRDGGQTRVKALEDRGVQVVQLTSDAAAGDRVSLKEVLKWFAAHQVTSVMLEGGCTLTSQALREDLVDKVNLFYAPRILGADAVPLVGNMLGQRVNLKQMEVTHFGDDILVQALIHDPWET